MADDELIAIDVPYGPDSLVVRVPKRNLMGIIRPNPAPIKDQLATLHAALTHPIASEPFAQFVSHPGEETLVVVNDATRPTPTAQVLPTLLETAKDANLYFAVATGAHGSPTRQEMRSILGDLYEKLAPRTFVHDCHNITDMVNIGRTSRGTNVSLNKLLLDADRTVILGSVEPHYFAGYTGGRKSLIPGMAAFETIEQNHSLALLPGVMPLALKKNPVHEDMVEGVAMLKNKPIFAINLVLDRDQNVYAATAGELGASFMAATQKADEIYIVPIRKRADVVVSVARSPLDRDLYQLQKTLEHGLLAVKEGGILILVSKCSNGVGERSYIELIRELGDPKQVIKSIRQDPSFGCHKAGRLAQAALRVKVFAVTDVDPNVIRDVFAEPYSFLQQAIDSALSLAGRDADMLFLMNGSVTVPRVQ